MYNNLSGKTAYQYLASRLPLTMPMWKTAIQIESNLCRFLSLKSGKPDYVSENTQGSEENMVERKKKNKPNPCIVICHISKSSAGRIGEE